MVGLVKKVGLGLAILVAATQLWDWTAPLLQGDGLAASVSFVPFLQVPLLRSELKSFDELLETESLASLVDLDRLVKHSNDEKAAEILVRDTLEEVSRSLRERLIRSLSRNYLLQPKGIYQVLVTNHSRRSLSEVTITLPDTQFLWLKREGENPSQCESGEIIKLGTLRPQESVALVSWTSSEPSIWLSVPGIILTHSEGVGDVAVRVPVGGLGQWFDKYWLAALFFSVGVSLIVVLVVVGMAESATESKE